MFMYFFLLMLLSTSRLSARSTETSGWEGLEGWRALFSLFIVFGDPSCTAWITFPSVLLYSCPKALFVALNNSYVELWPRISSVLLLLDRALRSLNYRTGLPWEIPLLDDCLPVSIFNAWSCSDNSSDSKWEFSQHMNLDSNTLDVLLHWAHFSR